jgi:hypothetical protein
MRNHITDTRRNDDTDQHRNERHKRQNGFQYGIDSFTTSLEEGRYRKATFLVDSR